MIQITENEEIPEYQQDSANLTAELELGTNLTEILHLPHFPTVKDEQTLLELIEYQKSQEAIPIIEEPLTEIDDKTSESPFYQTKQLAQSNIPIEFLNFSLPYEKPKKKINMDANLRACMEKLAINITKSSIATEDILTMLSFRTTPGVSIPTQTTSTHSTKSLIKDLLLLRIPTITSFFGGSKSLDHIENSQQIIGKSKKKEKERDSGQGKAPIKMSATRIAKIRAQKIAADIAAGRKPRPSKLDVLLLEKEAELAANIARKLDLQQIEAEAKAGLANSAGTLGSATSASASVNYGGNVIVNVNYGSRYNGEVDTPNDRMQEESETKSETIKCICANEEVDDGLFMIACDQCSCWFHGACVTIYEVLPQWNCPRCK
jgi:hypothetical protein